MAETIIKLNRDELFEAIFNYVRTKYPLTEMTATIITSPYGQIDGVKIEGHLKEKKEA